MVSVRQLTQGPAHHRFGSFGVTPWSGDGKRLLCFQTVPLTDRDAAEDYRANICIVDVASGKPRQIDRTSVWTEADGALLGWTQSPERVVFNDEVDGRLHGILLDPATSRRTVLQRAVLAVVGDGSTLITGDLDRKREFRASRDTAQTAQLPRAAADDGLLITDSKTSGSRLLVSYADLLAAQPLPEKGQSQPLWLDTATASPDGRRLLFTAGCFSAENPRETLSAAFTIGLDGRGLQCIVPFGPSAAKWVEWVDNARALVVQFHGKNEQPLWTHRLFRTGSREPEILAAPPLDRSAHARVSPDGRWMISDKRYGFGDQHALYLVELTSGRAVGLAALKQPKKAPWVGPMPAWRPDSRMICLETLDAEGTVQLFLFALNFAASEKSEDR